AGLLQERDLLRRRSAPERKIAMREAAEAVDDRLVRLSPPGELGIAQRGHQRDAALLRLAVLGVLERQVEEHALVFREAGIEALGDGALSHPAGLIIGGEGARRIAEYVARHLIEHDDGGQRGAGI